MKTLKPTLFALLAFAFLALAGNGQTNAPRITSLISTQRTGTMFVDISYNLIDPDNQWAFVVVECSTNRGTSYSVPMYALTGDVGFVAPGDSTQTGGEFRARGEHEYHAARGLAWSAAKKLFYVADEFGIFKLTTSGSNTFLARPAFPIDSRVDESRAIAFVTVTNLLVGHRNGSATSGRLEVMKGF